jgi:trimeric autotransporter adhesin
MRTNVLTYLFLSFFALPKIVHSQASCAAAYTLTPSTTCSPTAGDLKNANSATPAPTCGSGSAYSVWYKFTATSTSAIVTINNFANGIQTAPYVPYLEIFTAGTCGSFTSSLCQQATSGSSGSASITATGLTINTVYYIRVYTTTQKTSGNCGFDICVKSSPNDEPASATSVTPNPGCSTISGTLLTSTVSSGLPVGCEAAGNHWDVWYKFTAANTMSTITISSLGANFTNPEIQLYSGTPGSLTSMQCGTTTLTNSSLTIGTTYYVRVSNIAASAPSGTVTFNICVTYPPLNDDCANTVFLYSNTTCTNTSASLGSATASAGIPLGCAAAGTYYDVWFTFAAANASETITLSSMTGISSPAIQLYSGSCGALTSVACGTSSLTATGLSVGATYYVRVSNYNSAATSTGNFNICITHPAPATSTFDYGKSYVNISKNSGGGTINPGDTLEVRATLVIRGGSGLDSLSFLDTLHLGGGVRLVPGSISLRTNEGKIYKSFTDATGDDAGYYYSSGTDTVVRINFGTGASATTRGNLLNTSKPSVFGSTCIIMATYRVVVYAGYGTTLGLGGGKITTKDIGTGVSSDLSFSARNAIVYSSPGLCPNAVAASNAIGGDNNGTFGSGTVQNRAPSPNVTGYTYSTFQTSNPQDYYYGVANNTSTGGTGFTTVTTWTKPDNSSPTHRVFNVWDITGDHTGATNTSKGNPPCDPSQPVSPTNPCGYMLIVNSAYKTDTAFQYTVSNLCPNTYYEISAWMKNICYKCGCDSNGVGASSGTAGYIPSATNDSSGVQPNVTFDINGVDYYTSGNIAYGGLYPSTQTGSDSNNVWVKRGFTYLTGTAQTSLTLTIRNNAPGGGGNDWAMDDISLATCLPNMQYSPTLNPYACSNTVYYVRDTIRSYFSNYVNYKWQQSTDGGITWNDIPSASGTGIANWNGSAYEYVASYTIPQTATTPSNNGDKYRVVVGTTSGNLTDANCQVTDGVSQITLTVDDNCILLDTYILSFKASSINGRGNLYWTTSQETKPVKFEIEKSTNGNSFFKIGTVEGSSSISATNSYSFIDSSLSGVNYYRISIISKDGQTKYSRVIQLSNSQENFSVSNLTTYFQSAISFDVNVNKDAKIDLTLLNASGNFIKQQTVTAYNGSNNFIIPDLNTLSPGVYILQVRNKEKIVTLKTIKR